MSSRNGAGSVPAPARPPLWSLPADDVQAFRAELQHFLDQHDDEGRKWGAARWGVYAFYDYDEEPIYVGQTNEQLRTRVRRHLTNQRTDTVAMRVLDPFEVAFIEIWPLWEYEHTNRSDPFARQHLDALEYSVYLQSIRNSQFGAILNEKIPPVSAEVPLPPSIRGPLIPASVFEQRNHPDIRIARRAETISRLAAVARERGEVSPGLRRVLVIQAARLAYIASDRLAYAEGRPAPDPSAIDLQRLIGSVLRESDAESDDDD